MRTGTTAIVKAFSLETKLNSCTLRFLGSIALLASVGAAQVPTLLLPDGPVPGAPGQDLQAFGTIRTTQGGGFGVALWTTGAEPNQYMVWGSADGISPPGLLFVGGTHGGIVQEDWSTSQWDLDPTGSVLYTARDANNVWYLFKDDVVVQQAPIGSNFFNLELLADGTIYYLLRTGNVLNLFDGAGQPQFVLGSMIPGLPGTLHSVDEFALAEDESTLLAVVTLHDPGYVTPHGTPQSFRQAVLLDGVPAQISGETLLTGTAPPGEDDWIGFHSPAVNTNGDWGIICHTAAWGAPWQMGFGLYVNEEFHTGAANNLSVNEFLNDFDLTTDGDSGVVLAGWDVISYHRVRKNGSNVLFSGDSVDDDGDGLPDAGSSIESIEAFAIDSNYFYTAMTSLTGAGYVQGLYRTPHRIDAETYCTAKASSSNCLATISGSPGLPTLGQSDYAVNCTGVEAARNGLFFYGANGPLAVPFQGGTLCVTPPLGRMTVQNSSGTPGTCAGAFTQIVNDPASPWAPGPGDGLWLQAWHRDPPLNDGFDVALSNALFLIFH